MSTPHLANCKEAFGLSPIPVWVLDIDTFRVIWANPVGLEFWRASTLEELEAREMLNTVPEAVLVRLRQTITKLHLGVPFQEDWTFFPKGKPMPVMLHLRPIELADGRVGMLNQAVRIDETTSESTIRALTMLRHAKATLVYVDENGTILAQNSGSIVEFGDGNSWLARVVDPETGRGILGDAIAGNTVTKEMGVQSLNGLRVHAVTAHGLRDPIAGGMGVLIQHFDVTERVEAEKLVQAHLSTLREQQQEILALSTPFLDVGAHTLALPLIGRIDESRAHEITSRLLEMVVARGIERVILDITGVVSVDSASITFVRRLVDAVKLLGAKPIVTGIRSDLARILAASDENLAGITIKRSLADGLAQGSSPRGSFQRS